MISQLTQNMKLHRSFRGMYRVFGILTTFTEWKVIGLPDCDSYAKSKSLDNSSTFEANDDVIVSNEVSGTEIVIQTFTIKLPDHTQSIPFSTVISVSPTKH